VRLGDLPEERISQHADRSPARVESGRHRFLVDAAGTTGDHWQTSGSSLSGYGGGHTEGLRIRVAGTDDADAALGQQVKVADGVQDRRGRRTEAFP